jgi:putative flippase GtrA
VTRFLRFCAVGTLAYLVDAGVLTALVSGAGLDPYAARVVSFLTAASFTWWLNRHWTFEVKRAPTRAEWLTYVTLMLIGAAVNYGTYAAAIMWWPLAREHLWLGVALGSVAGLGVNFLSSSRLFGRTPRSA